MTITTRDHLVDALANRSERLLWDKASLSTFAGGNHVSLWRANGQPGQGAIPAAAAACNNVLLGGFSIPQQTLPVRSYGAYMEVSTSLSASSFEIHDRIAHMGGLNGTLTTAQTVGLDLNTLSASENIAERMGASDYSDVQWWLEWYTATGATAVTATVAVTYHDGTTGNLSVSLSATRPASLAIPLNGSIPAAGAGKYIRAVNSVTLSATTGTAGSFGVTCTRLRMGSGVNVSYLKEVRNAFDLGLPEIYAKSCLFIIVQTPSTSSGVCRGQAKIANG